MKWYDLTAWRNTLKIEQIGEKLPDDDDKAIPWIASEA